MVSWVLGLESSLRFLRRCKAVDMFPCTVGVDLFPCCVDIHGLASTHVETIVLIQKKTS